ASPKRWTGASGANLDGTMVDEADTDETRGAGDRPAAGGDGDRAATTGGHARRLAWAAVFVASATGISRLTGLAREILTADSYGLSADLGVFTSVSVIPNLIRQLFADAAISAAFVPVFAQLFSRGETQRAYRLASSLLTFMIVVVGGLVLTLVIAAPLLVRLVYPALANDAELDRLATQTLQLLLPTVLVFSVAGVITGVLYAYERFVMPAVVSIVWNLVIIFFLVFYSEPSALGIYALVLGTVAGTVAELVLLILAVRRVDLDWSLSFHWRDSLFRRVLVLMVPVTITLGILNFNAVVDIVFAQFVSVDASAQLNYAFRLYQLPQGMFAITIATVLFPMLSRYAAHDDVTGVRDTISLGVRQVFFISLPFAAWFVVVPDAVVRLIYQHGSFTASDTALVAPVLAFFTLGMLFANANIMFNRGFQSLQRPWLPLYVGLVNLGLNALLDWALYRPLGVGGIVLSTSIVSAFNFVALLWLMRRQIDRVDGRRIARATAKMAVGTAALAVVSYALWESLQGFAEGGFAQLLVTVVVVFAAGGLVYLAAARLLHVEELGVLRTLVRRRARPALETDTT
ncbi:MAG TPA: murein biosynthesis integral membrane protein MurJ, partial [Thermoleophilia bacterium]|nr:murein biosynthesis integral membrane protein MurJ [Thermoleophilia bacterium]